MIRLSSSPARVCLMGAVCMFGSTAHADFFSDSKASIELRNMYMNRDFRHHGAAQSRAEEWGQGFTLRYASGFTEGTVGFGVDAIGQLGLKLDSGRGRRGTGLLPFDSEQRPEDDYSELGATAKIRLSKTVLRLGTLQPRLPVVTYNDSRLLASTFNGGLLTSQEIEGLTLNAGRIRKINDRDSTGNDAINYAGVNSSHLDLAGGEYRLTPELKLSYYYGKMADIYRQHFVGLVHTADLAEGVTLTTDLRYFDSRETGGKRFRSGSRVDGGRIDNQFFNGVFMLRVQAHSFALGYQTLSGDGDFPFPGLDPYSVNLVTYNAFTKANTDAWQVRYDYDFAALGIPGLSFMTRYLWGDGIRTADVRNGKEWERDTDIGYVIQSGPLKDVSIRLRNTTFRSGGGLKTDLNESRIILGYNLQLL